MNNKIPSPIVTLLCGLGIYFSRNLFPVFSHNYLDEISIVLLMLGFLTLISAVLSFKKQKTTVNPLKPEKASSLVTSGVFKYSRNPMYLGMLFILCSISIKFNLLGGLIIIYLFVFFITKFQIIQEEIAMESLFKEEFSLYKEKTRRWI